MAPLRVRPSSLILTSLKSLPVRFSAMRLARIRAAGLSNDWLNLNLDRNITVCEVRYPLTCSLGFSERELWSLSDAVSVVKGNTDAISVVKGNTDAVSVVKGNTDAISVVKGNTDAVSMVKGKRKPVLRYLRPFLCTVSQYCLGTEIAQGLFSPTSHKSTYVFC